jgi:hypothetical protein
VNQVISTATTKRRIVLPLIALAAAAGGLGLYSAISAAGERTPTPVEQLRAQPPGPGRFAKAYGLNTAEATAVFTLRNGASVAVVEDKTAKCMLTRHDGGLGETCDTRTAIDDGQAISVTDECGAAGGDLMEITGLAPDDIATVRLDASDGSSKTAVTTHSAFKFEGTNPAPGAPYPTGVTWIGASGSAAGSAHLLVEGGRFCIPAP